MIYEDLCITEVNMSACSNLGSVTSLWDHDFATYEVRLMAKEGILSAVGSSTFKLGAIGGEALE